MDDFKEKKRKVRCLALLHSLVDELALSEARIGEFAEQVHIDPEDFHDLMYKLAQYGHINETQLDDFLDAADTAKEQISRSPTTR